MLRESDSKVGHFMTSPKGHVLRMLRRLENILPALVEIEEAEPLAPAGAAAESPSTKTSLLPSGENAGTIMTALPRPQLLAVWPLTLTGAVPGVLESCQMT